MRRRRVVSRHRLSTSSVVCLLCFCPMLTASWRPASIFRGRYVLHQVPGPRQSLSNMQSASLSSLHDEHEVDCRLEHTIQEEIQRLNNNQQINLNSPKQVSTAIFGNVQSTSRQVLELAAQGKIASLSSTQQQLAALVQQYRDIVSAKKKQYGKLSMGSMHDLNSRQSASTDQARSFSTSALTESVDDAGSNDDTAFEFIDAPLPATPKFHRDLSPYEQQVNTLFDRLKTKLDPYWREPLLRLTRPTARNLVNQLDPLQCPMGFDPMASPASPMMFAGADLLNEDEETTANLVRTKTTTAGKKGSFLAYCREQKEKYPDVILLTRCGDFYETYGIDAILLVEHCGLNAMAGKAKAGCPIRNVQATLDCLTTQGFRVAVYEEACDTDASRGTAAAGGPKSRIKNRFLAQIVSAASPTYLYDLVLLGNNADLLGSSSPPPRPYVGVMSLDAGYTLVEISVEEQSVRVTERLTAEAVACRLAAYPPADPLMYVPSMAEYRSSSRLSLPFLPSKMDYVDSGPGARLRTHIIPPTLVEEASGRTNDLERAKDIILIALLRMTQADDMTNLDMQAASRDDFTLVNPASVGGSSAVTYTHSLHKETASQLGLMGDKAIPPLVSYLVPESAPAATRRFLRRYLLTPPPPVVAEAMRDLVSHLKTTGSSMPPLCVPPIGKVLSLLRASQASAEIYRELIDTLQSTEAVLDSLMKETEQPQVIESLMTLIEYESGMAASPISVKTRCRDASDAIANVVYASIPSNLDTNSEESMRISRDDAVPSAFFERNESPWKGRVRYDTMPKSYEAVRAAATGLADAIRLDFEPDSNSVLQDIFNNLLLLRDIPKMADDKSKYIHPRDRFGKTIRNRYTTDRVQDAVSSYVDACERAKQEVSAVLIKLSLALHEDGHMPAIVQASHANLLISAAFHHAANANHLGWNIAKMYENSSDDKAARFVGLWPYWMDRVEGVSNTFDLDGMWILTAPNMSGKSTILRSTAAASLLVSCGLCAPVSAGSSVRRFDHIFVRGASSDVPTENKSAFGAEMEDIASLLRSCGDRSLVFVDELARGTSPRDGTVLAAAVLEEMAGQGMSGIFATHLHELLDLPLQNADRIQKKRMEMQTEHDDHSTRYKWTFHLVNGVCLDSLALETAQRFGVPKAVLDRAKSFRTQLAGTLAPVTNVASLRSGGDDASKIVRGVNSQQDVYEIVSMTVQANLTMIPSSWVPPASLEGTSCVYIMSLCETGSEARKYYVGETDSLRQRIEQHRAKGDSWSNAETIAIPVSEGKTEARALESLLIRTLAKAGVDLVSIADGRSARHQNRIH
ncbi:hypothetical protein MPSEU_000271400 [Mayamaea pseudoterrestris]|nr:hypothetical protein MPSEU_000271400 [Mayamaea pseudoterrestris]